MQQSGIEGQGDGAVPSRVLLTTNARRNLELRSISAEEVMRALASSATSHIDERTGHLVFSLKGGDIQVVARREDDAIVVMTAFRRAEFADDVG